MIDFLLGALSGFLITIGGIWLAVLYNERKDRDYEDD